MRRILARVATMAGLLGLVGLDPFAGVARAETPPSRWDRARDPAAGKAYDVHEQVQRRLLLARVDRVMDSSVREAGDILERNGAETSSSPLLRYDLAEVYELKKDHARAAKILKAAIAEFPNHPSTENGWIRLAFACGHLGDHVCERDAYREVLRIETEEVLRGTPTLNLAETQMHLGDLKEAIEGYREALRIAGRMPTRDTAPLATWGLAVALDRSGDRINAEKEARFALEIERSMGMSSLPHSNHSLLRSENVFFVPVYEIHWYEGLGAAAAARAATSSREALALWTAAERSFGDYVRLSDAQDRWLPIAKARLAQIKAERARVEKAPKVERKPEVDPEESPVFVIPGPSGARLFPRPPPQRPMPAPIPNPVPAPGGRGSSGAKPSDKTPVDGSRGSAEAGTRDVTL